VTAQLYAGDTDQTQRSARLLGQDDATVAFPLRIAARVRYGHAGDDPTVASPRDRARDDGRRGAGPADEFGGWRGVPTTARGYAGFSMTLEALTYGKDGFWQGMDPFRNVQSAESGR
jgi:hypothetical protein